MKPEFEEKKKADKKKKEGAAPKLTSLLFYSLTFIIRL